MVFVGETKISKYGIQQVCAVQLDYALYLHESILFATNCAS